jgi:hypothetical protein
VAAQAGERIDVSAGRPERRSRVDLQALADMLIDRMHERGLVIVANRENVPAGKPAAEKETVWPESENTSMDRSSTGTGGASSSSTEEVDSLLSRLRAKASAKPRSTRSARGSRGSR